MNYKIFSRFEYSKVLFEFDTPEKLSLRGLVELAVGSGANLSEADLSGANLSGANLLDAKETS